MRVLQIGSSLHDWGGIERYVAYLTEGLISRGHEVAVVCPPGSPLDRRLPGPKFRLALNGKYRFDRLPALFRLMRQTRWDVVHAHFSPDYLVPALAARLARAPLVVMTRHVAIPWRSAKARQYGKLFHGFIAVSDAVGAKLIQSGVPAERVRVAKAGVPGLAPKRGREAVRSEMGIGEEVFAVGFFGRLVADKGIATLIEAARRVDPAKVQFQVFGDGPLVAAVRGAEGAITARGFVPDVADAMAAMDAVAIPSVWEEAFPYSALEAMSLGRPIVASDIGGLPELVAEGRTGRLVPPGDAAALAEVCTELAQDRSLAKTMGLEARARHDREFRVEHMAERIESAYVFLHREV
ncbi:MAG: glycosyltransferase family 4 protein [Fimbriimonadaceae bacterium]